MRNNREQLVRQIMRNLNPYFSGIWLTTDTVWNCWTNKTGSEGNPITWNYLASDSQLLNKADRIGRAYSRMIHEVVKQATWHWKNADCVRLLQEEPELYRFICRQLKERFDAPNEVAADDEKQYMGNLIIHHVVSAYRLDNPLNMLQVSNDTYFAEKHKCVWDCANEVGNAMLSACSEYKVSEKPVAKKEEEGMNVDADTYAYYFANLPDFPWRMTVKGNLDLRSRTDIVVLPDCLTVYGNLNLEGCTNLMELPDGLTVHGDLNLCRCTWLTQLPENLTVDGDLNLVGCTGIKKLPDSLGLGGKILYGR